VRLPHLALVCVLGLGVVACSASEDESPGSNDSATQGKVLQPGRPGEANETVDPDDVVAQPGTDRADVAFMQQMVPHHAQALEMSQLAQTRASDDQVVAMARRIKGAQGPEILGMTSWLRSRGLEVPETMADAMGAEGGHGGHGSHGGDDRAATARHGMLTERQMSALAAARGNRFDRLFLAGMIQHHEGAVAMARDEIEAGSDTVAMELAADVAAGQQAEIRRLVAIRRQL
jgi:uncharacterized protein (DUF305 family)